MKRWIAILLTLALCLSSIACSKSAETDDFMTGAAAPEMSWDVDVEEEVKEEVDYGSINTSGPANGAGQNTLPSERKMIRDVNMHLETMEYDKTIAALEQSIAAYGGYVETMSQSGSRYSSSYGLESMNVTARIPAERLDAFLNQVDGMGNVLSKNLSTRDVTASYVDVQSRLEVLRNEKTVLDGIMKSATNTKDMLEAQDRLYDVIEEIESYEAVLRSYDSLVAYSTVSIYVEEVKEPTPEVEETRGEELARRWKKTVENFVDNCVDFGFWLVENSFTLLILAGIGLGIYFIIRGIIRRSRKKRAKRLEELRKAQEAHKAQ